MSAPSYPTSLSVLSKDKHLILSFDINDTSVINYEYSIDDGNTYILYDPPATESPLVISNLVNGVSYKIKLKSINYIGKSSPSETVIGIPVGVPESPIVNIISGNNKLILNLSGSNGGSMITEYKYSINNGEYLSKYENNFEILNLINGFVYNIKIVALNQIGSSNITSILATPYTFPSKPISLSVEPLNLKVIVNFFQENDGGSPIFNYKYSLDNGQTYNLFEPYQNKSPLTIDYSIAKIKENLQIRIKAVNIAGESVESDMVLGKIPCLLAGMKIYTKTGYCFIESLKIGDEIIDSNGNIVNIENIIKTDIIGNKNTVPYIIPKNFFEKDVPSEDLFISSNHAYFYKKWDFPMFTIGLKKDYTFLNQNFTYYHIKLPNYDSNKLICNNLIVDSFNFL